MTIDKWISPLSSRTDFETNTITINVPDPPPLDPRMSMSLYLQWITKHYIKYLKNIQKIFKASNKFRKNQRTSLFMPMNENLSIKFVLGDNDMWGVLYCACTSRVLCYNGLWTFVLNCLILNDRRNVGVFFFFTHYLLYFNVLVIEMHT